MKSINLIKPYFIENRRIIILGLLCLVVVDFLQLFIPRIIKWAVDDIAAFKTDVNGLLVYALYIVTTAVMIGLFRYIWRRCLIGTSRKVEEGLRNRLFAHIQTLSAAYFNKTKTGDLMAHATNDIMHIRMATGMGLVALADAIVLGSAAICFMAYINKLLTLLVLVPMPILIFGSRFFTKKMHRLYKAVQESFSNLTEAARESFSGIRIIKAYNWERETLSRTDAISKDNIAKNISLVRIVGSFFPMMVFFSNLSLAIVLYFGGRQTIALTITPGDFVAFISYLGLLMWPMMAAGWVVNLIQRGRASLNRIDKILSTRPEIEDLPDALPVGRVKGKVLFESVSFAYHPDTRPVLSGIDLKLEPGQILGVTGSLGSGKTTLLSLIPRIYEVSEGQISIDDKDIRRLRLPDLRSQISFVPQEPFIFAGTVRHNIVFGNKNADSRMLSQAVREAFLEDTIKSFPKGLETVVGEKGVILSGGQKQRLAMARAFLHNSPILILDDPVSQVDTATGDQIINTIRSKAGQKTIIIASHRLAALRMADHIIVLENGSLLEAGTHLKLIKNGGFYAKIFSLQELEKELDAY